MSEYLHQELLQQSLVKLTEEEAKLAGIHCSPIGVISKKNKLGKWRLIVDLPSLEGASINDEISKDMCSMLYTSVDVITEKVVLWGTTWENGHKAGVQNCTGPPGRQVSISLSYLIYLYLFGLLSALLLFTVMADPLQWMMEHNDATFVDHYIVDYITVGMPKLALMHETYCKSGTPVEEDKLKGPSMVLLLLEIEIRHCKNGTQAPR